MAMPLLLILLVATQADDKLPDALQKELKPLQGEWVMVRGEKNVETIEFKDGPELILENQDNKWLFTGREKGHIVAIDGKADPKTMDVKSVEPGRDGMVDEAIFKLDGDTLTMALYQGKEKRRPTEFKSSDKDTIVTVFNRVKKK